jgi:hypothetical protein
METNDFKKDFIYHVSKHNVKNKISQNRQVILGRMATEWNEKKPANLRHRTVGMALRTELRNYYKGKKLWEYDHLVG